MTKCRKRAKCAYCEDTITKGDYMVVGKLWRRYHGQDAEVMHRCFIQRWHVDCWVEQGKRAADTKDEQRPETRGRPKLVISDEDRAERRKLLVRRANIIYRIRKVQESNPYDIDALIRLGTLLHKADEIIKQYGGAPKSW